MRRLLYIGLIFSGSLNAQVWDTISLEDFSVAIVDAEEKIDIKKSFSYEASYTFYNDHKSSTPEMTEKTIVTVLNGVELHMTQLGRIIVQDASTNLILDTATRTVAIAYANPNLIRKKTSEDFTSFLSSECKAMKKAAANFTKYRLEFPEPARYEAAEVWINKDGTVRKYILFGRKEIVDDSEESELRIKPRMEITYTDYRFGSNVNTTIPLVSDFISTDNNEIKLTSQYEDYELIDLRIPNE